MRLRRLAQLEQVGEFAQDLALRRRLGLVAIERLLGVAAGLLKEAALFAALRALEFDLALGAFAERLREQLRLLEIAIDQHQPRGGHLLVELREEAGQHLVLGHLGGVLREEAAVPPILAAADEEGLQAHRPALAGERPDVGIRDAFGVDRLRALDRGQRAQPVAQDARPARNPYSPRPGSSGRRSSSAPRSTCRRGSSSRPRPARHRPRV